MGVFQLTETPTGKKKQNGKKEPKKSLKKQSKYFLKLKNKTASDVGGEGWGGGTEISALSDWMAIRQPMRCLAAVVVVVAVVVAVVVVGGGKRRRWYRMAA